MTIPCQIGDISSDGIAGAAIRLSECAAAVTNEPVAPSGTLMIGRAGRFVREQSLKIKKRARERQITSLKHVDNHDHLRLAQMFNITGSGHGRQPDKHASMLFNTCNSRRYLTPNLVKNELRQFRERSRTFVLFF
jgi:hypothetical protein